MMFNKVFVPLCSGHVAPVFLGFECQDNNQVTYGHIHIPSISLKEIPVQREQLRLKLSYGSKKITTFNADLWDKQVGMELLFAFKF